MIAVNLEQGVEIRAYTAQKYAESQGNNNAAMLEVKNKWGDTGLAVFKSEWDILNNNATGKQGPAPFKAFSAAEFDGVQLVEPQYIVRDFIPLARHGLFN